MHTKVLDEQFKVLLTAVNEQETGIPQTESSTVPMNTSSHTWNGTVGAKIGKTSRYHYVNFDRKKDRYKGSTSFGGKTIHIGTFKDEIECALMVDIFLDSTEDDGGRLRNRNDFPEVMEAYMIQQEVQHEK